MSKWLMLLVGLLLISCGNRDIPAPVSDLGVRPANLPAFGHRVKRGETLYAIAFLYDVDYKELARINHINPPYTLAVGQLINFHPTSAYRQPIKTYSRPYIRRRRAEKIPTQHFNNVQQRTYLQRNGRWMWPVRGVVKSSFAPFMARKGIEIAGRKGDKIYAAQSGIVAYAGSGLANYGNLIIIKHPNNYLTAYGNNAKNLVKEGQYVNAGQVIAEMGIINHQYYGLHFEIRQKGKPLNPLLLLRR